MSPIPRDAPGTKWDAKITWGDGTAPEDKVPATALPNGTFEFLGNHTYGQSGTFTITVMIAVPGSHLPNDNTVTTSAVISAAVTLQSIAVTPANPTLAKGLKQQFTATGTFSDNSTQNLTNQVTWASVNQSVATMTAAGLASAVNTGTSTISATLNGITGSTVLTVTAVATKLVATGLPPATATAGTSVSFTISAEDSSNTVVPGYTGTVKLSSTDGQAVFPSAFTFAASDAGSHTFTVTLASAGNQTVTVADQSNASLSVTTTPIAVSAGAVNKLVVNAVPSVVAGKAFIVTAQAADLFGNPVAGFSGPVTFTTTDPQVPTLAGGTVTNGLGFTLGTLTTVAGGPWTITATAGAVKGTSSPIAVTPAAAAYFAVTVPATAITGTAVSVTVKAFDEFQNLATGYAGLVHLGSGDPKATLPGDSPLTGGSAAFDVTLNTAGNQTITASDAIARKPITISGISASIATSGLKVTNLTKTATGFTATFNQAINPADLTIFGTGSTQQDVVFLGKSSNNSQPYPGTLIVDASKKTLTFNVSSDFLVASSPSGSAALPDDTYTVTLISGVAHNGFQNLSGQGLDDGHGGPADFVGTFTTTYQHDNTQVLGIPDFARGPNASGDTTTLIKVPNDPANDGHVGIPITIYNAANLTSAGFTLTYNANILIVTGGISDPSNASATFKMTSNVPSADGVHSVATFAFTSATPLSGTRILGDITAFVPFAARNQYQVKDLLVLANIAVSGGATVVPANAVDVDAYFGDVNGDHHIDGVDKGLIANVASTSSTGFTAFTLLDPAIIGDLSGDNAVTSNSTSLVSNYLLALPVAKIPALPNPPIADNLFASPFAADPVLSVPASVQVNRDGVVNVPVLLDQPRPEGSTGLIEAELALTFDPSVLRVSASDITLGSIPSQGSGWQLSAMVNAATGQLTIQLYSETPIASDQAGSLVNIAFHLKSGTTVSGETTVQLLNSQTVLADSQAAMILGPGLNWTSVLTSEWVQSLQ